MITRRAISTAGGLVSRYTPGSRRQIVPLSAEEEPEPGPPPEFASVGTFHSTFGSTPQFPVPAGVAADDLIVIPIYIGSTLTITAMPAGFAHAEGSPVVQTAVGADDNSIAVVWKRASGADSGTYDFTLSGGDLAEGAAARFTGVVTSGNPFDTPTDSSTESIVNGNTPPPVAITTAAANRLLLYVGSNWGGGAWTPPTGFTERTDGGFRVHTVATKTQTDAGSTGDVSATCAASQKTAAWLGALKPTV